MARVTESNRFWSIGVDALQPYVPGEQPGNRRLTKLNTNENPYPPSPRVLDAIRSVVDGSLRLYPDPDSSRLKAAIAGHYGVRSEQVTVGNSSDEILAHIFQALFKQRHPLLFPDITYGFYPVYARLYGIDFRPVPLTDDFQIDIDDYLQPNAGILFPNPNAPTGVGLPISRIERLLDANRDSAVVIDEAYIDFGGRSAVELVDRYDNLLVVQTFSKSRSLAGLRVGFAIGDAGLIAAVERIKNSFNSYPLDRLAQAGATAAIEDVEYFDRTRNAIIASREKLAGDLQALGFQVLPSMANFVFARHPGFDGAWLVEQLRRGDILVRHFKNQRTSPFLRISIGLQEECDAVVEALRVLTRPGKKAD